jgi:hypothetical protein
MIYRRIKMNKRGYKSVIHGSRELLYLVANINAHEEIIADLIEAIDEVAIDRSVTKTELIRDYGFTNSSLRLLEKNKQLIPSSIPNKRKKYDLAKALKIRVLQPWILAAKHVRTNKKHTNIVTIYRNCFNKITDIRT